MNESQSQNRLVGARYGRYEYFTSAPVDSTAIGGTAFCLFIKTQDFIKRSMSQEMLNDFIHNMKQTNFDIKNVFVHASYDLNLCEWNQRLRSKYIKRLIYEMSFSQKMGFSLFNLHIGSCPSNSSSHNCLSSASEMIDEVLAAVPDINITLENSAGFGAQLGAGLGDIAQIMALSHFTDRIGFALNTSHAFSYGYDFRTIEKYHEFIDQIDQTIGLNKLQLMFFNDSKSDFGDCTDIHENLGLGKMSPESFQFFLSDQRLDHIPIILETPNPALWNNEIKFIKSNAQNEIIKKDSINV